MKMWAIFKIMRKELLRWANSTVFYILFGVLLFCIGIYTWFFNEAIPFFDIDRIMPASLQAIYWGLAVFIPILATGTILEERRLGTLKVILAKPISVQQFVFGKLAAIKVVLFIFLLLTLCYYFSIADLTKITWQYLLIVYLFLFLMSIAYAIISMAISCFFNVYWKSYLWSYLCIFTLHFFADFLGSLSIGEVRIFFYYWGMQTHFDYFLEGGFALSTIVYLSSLIFIGLFIIIYKLSRDHS